MAADENSTGEPSGSDDHKVPERGYGMGYQESVEIEARTLFGMEADEFYRRQVGLVLDRIPDSVYGDKGAQNLAVRPMNADEVLPEGVTLRQKARAAGMKLVDSLNFKVGPGKKILDLAVGEGDTSRYLATTGASIEARDIETYLVERAKQRDAEVREGREAAAVEEVRSDVRKQTGRVLGEVNYQSGDYSRVKDSVAEGEQFDAITCLSRSFIYLGERENYVKALKDFNDLLVPGGKVVLQSRKHLKQGDFPWAAETGTKLEFENGEFAMIDEKSGTRFVWRTDEEKRILSDGVKQSKGSRYLQYADGTRKELGKVVSDDHLDFDNLKGMGEMLREAGFKNIRLKVENMTEDGTEIMYALVAEKPKGGLISRARKLWHDRVAGLLGGV